MCVKETVPMSLKLIEMQFALHKNDEAGLKQHQMMHKPVEDQAVLSDAADKNTVKERQVSGKTEETSHTSVRDGDTRQQRQQSRKHRNQGVSEEGKPSEPRRDHPFKGRHIDLSL
jgi:hypothetical protein